jgi:hypothetical protein
MRLGSKGGSSVGCDFAISDKELVLAALRGKMAEI